MLKKLGKPFCICIPVTHSANAFREYALWISPPLHQVQEDHLSHWVVSVPGLTVLNLSFAMASTLFLSQLWLGSLLDIVLMSWAYMLLSGLWDKSVLDRLDFILDQRFLNLFNLLTPLQKQFSSVHTWKFSCFEQTDRKALLHVLKAMTAPYHFSTPFLHWETPDCYNESFFPSQFIC